MARDLISIMDEIPAEAFELDMKIVLPDDVQWALSQSAKRRADAAEAQAEAAFLSRQAAQQLRALGLSLRDIGRALGVTFQRAKQLLDDANRTNRA